jgi:hypothetical protein
MSGDRAIGGLCRSCTCHGEERDCGEQPRSRERHTHPPEKLNENELHLLHEKTTNVVVDYRQS